MAPKREAGPQVDPNPYGAFINLSVKSSMLILGRPHKPATPPPERGKPAAVSGRKSVDPSVEGPPQTHLVVTYPGDWGPLSSAPVPYEEGAGMYEYAWEGKFRKDTSLEALHELINNSIRIAVHDARSGHPLAWADVDVLEFGMGASTINLGTLPLTLNPAVPPGSYKAMGGSIYGVSLWLTHRPPPPPSPDPSTAQPSLPPSLSRSNTNKPHRESHAAPIDPDQLPEPQPFSFLPPRMAKGCNVLELQLKGGIAPLPPTLPAAVAGATDNKAGSMLQINLGLHLPGGGPSIVLPNGVLSSGSDSEVPAGAAPQTPPTTTSTHAPPGTFAPNLLVFEPPRCRVLLSSADVQALVHMLEDGGQLQCEVARFLASDSLTDPAWPAFRGVAVVPRSKDLLMPGMTEVQQEPQEACPLQAVPASGFASALPHYVPPQGKGVKVLEEGLPLPPHGSPPPCAWAEAGSQLQGLSVRFARPLVPAWQPPPSRPLMELLPPSTNLQPHVPSKAAVLAFKDQVQQMAAALVDLQLSGKGGAHNGQQQAALSLQQLKEQLAKSGRLAELRDGLRRSSVAVAMEQHRRGVGGEQLTEQQKASLLVDLHSSLESAMNEALGMGSHQQESSPQQQQDGAHSQQQLQERSGGEGGKERWLAQLAHLQQLAQECEVTGAHRRAEALYQRLVTIATDSNAVNKAQPPDPDKAGHEMAHGVEVSDSGVQGETLGTAGHVDGSTTAEPLCSEAQQAMYAYATFCLRCGHCKHGRAEQLLRRALGLPPTRCSSAWPAAGEGTASGHDGGGGDGGEGNGHNHAQGAPTEASDGGGGGGGGGGGIASLHGQPRPGHQYHVPSLLALALLLLHHGRVTDGMLLEEAAELARQVGSAGVDNVQQHSAVCFQLPGGLCVCAGAQLVAVVRGSNQEPLAWAVLYMVCQASGDAARAEDIAASLVGLQRAEAEGLMPVEPLDPTSPASPCGPEPPAAGAELQGGGLPELPAAGAELQGGDGPEGSGAGTPAPPQLGSSSQCSPSDRPARTSSQASRQARATGEGAASEGGSMAELSQPSLEDVPLCLAPSTSPHCVNGMLALASLCATELALPVLTLAAWQQGVVELQASLSVPEVSAEMELAGAHAYRWIYCWEKEVAAQADSRFGVGEEDGDGAAALGLPMEGSELDRAQAEELGGQGMSRMGSQGSGMQKRRSSTSGQSDQGLGGGEAAAKAALASTMEPVPEGDASNMGKTGADLISALSAAPQPNQGQEGGQDATMGGSRASQREQKELGSSAPQKEAERGQGQGLATGSRRQSKAGQEGDGGVACRAHARAAEVLEAALELCTAAGAVLGGGDVRPRLLAGELLFLAGRWPEAIQSFSSSMATLDSSACSAVPNSDDAEVHRAAAGGALPLPLVMQLARSYQQLGFHDDALNLCLQAATRSPCASVWLQAGRAHAQLGQHVACEAALAEAVALDAESPHVWAALALAAMSGGPSQAATSGCAALACALRLGLEDVGLLRELSGACYAAGLDAEARSCLEAAVAIAPKKGAVAVEARLQLAQALVRACEFGPGRVCYEAALAISTSQRQQQSVKRHLLATRLLSR